MLAPLDVLADSRYVLLTTFRRDGTPVPTPVWAARVGDELRVISTLTAGKVKRLRRTPRALVAPCTVRGRPLGNSIEVSGQVLDESELLGVRAALISKYGWPARFALLRDRLMTALGRTPPQVAAIAVTFEAPTYRP